MSELRFMPYYPELTLTKQQYEYALCRIDKLLPIVTDDMPMTDDRMVELTMVSDIVKTYEKGDYPMKKSQDNKGWKRL